MSYTDNIYFWKIKKSKDCHGDARHFLIKGFTVGFTNAVDEMIEISEKDFEYLEGRINQILQETLIEKAMEDKK